MSTDTEGCGTAAKPPESGYLRDHTAIALLPVAAPSILGLFGFAAATFMVAANLAGWYGTTEAPQILFPFALAAGGIAELLAAMWAFVSRDGLATAMHGVWGSFWIGYGLYNLLIALAVLPPATSDTTAAVAFGFWLVVLSAVTLVGAIAATAENIALTTVLATLAASSVLLAIALLGGVAVIQTVGAYVLLAAAALAWYLAAAMMLEATAERAVLPIGKRRTVRLPATCPRPSPA
ncbi:acetate uptake transporter family protein [Pseudonocardia alaniniphila]|uniref:GPR1/FUN34/YaaH family transporter n=1 Tax=Pseudonocardia alaniniphila TaxID=75291 RepID=A0ABS9TSS7_9PSEU|nr:GPR1/FUN34/YaaH family transporter [Pseudonocardia alaniniphila]MCH6171574.1 GPR1/FUN34/YaaH family transporter [Pseudonocardia alaniniphila]